MNTRVNLAGVELKNPVMTASGTFGSGAEYGELVDLNQLGAVVTKGVANVPWPGNPTPRIAETYGGMLNAIGLQNPGIDVVVKRDIPFLKQFDTKIIVNVCGKTTEDYVDVVERLADEPVDMLEINISCPNVKAGGMNFGVKAETAAEVVRKVREVCRHKMVVKLSPNAENITELALACEAEGADGLSLTNTYLAMAIDINKRKPVFDNVYAGLSGPAIKPISLRMVHQVAHAVKIPVMGLGGITTWQDALEFIMAGAAVIQVGTASFMKPSIAMDIIDGLEKYLEEQNIGNISELRGIV